MTTVVNNPAPVISQTPAESTGGSGLLIGAVVLIGFIVLILFIGIPAIRRMDGPVNVNLPETQVNVPETQVNIPDKIDVNVSQ